MSPYKRTSVLPDFDKMPVYMQAYIRSSFSQEQIDLAKSFTLLRRKIKESDGKITEQYVIELKYYDSLLEAPYYNRSVMAYLKRLENKKE